MRDAGLVVAGGFHSPMERECLAFLLRGVQPVILCPARHPYFRGLPAPLKTALQDRRLASIAPFGDRSNRTTQKNAEVRNGFVADLSTVVFVPHASPGGKTEALANRVLRRVQPLFTFDVVANEGLLAKGARPYHLPEIVAALSAAAGAIHDNLPS